MFKEIMHEAVQPLPTSIDGIYKADLHVHIGALAMGKTMLRLAEKYNLDRDELAPFFKLQQWPNLLAFHQEYERFYGKLLRAPQDYYDVVYEYLMQAAKHNTLYVELSVSLRPLTNGRISNEEMLGAIGKAFRDAKHDAAEAGYEPIEAGLIASTIRDMGPQHAMWVAEEAVRLKKDFKFIYGFGMSGDENHPTPLKEYKPAFQYAHENGLGCTMHAGETSVKTLVNAIDELGEYLQRIGHGIHAMKDMKFIERYIRQCRHLNESVMFAMEVGHGVARRSVVSDKR